MKKLTTLLILLFKVATALSQSPSQHFISGKLIDSISGTPIPYANILAIINSESKPIVIQSNDSGIFKLAISSSNVTLSISMLGYRTITKSINFSNRQYLDLGNILLSSQNIELLGITVSANTQTIRITKDTTEISTIGIYIQENQKLQDLLQKFPGLNVSGDGTISYNGVKIESLMVNGKIYFNNNIKIALENLDATIIDKIQIIDQVKELSVSDGTSNLPLIQKSLNIITKQNKKNKLVGHISFGFNNKEKYFGNSTLNKFGTTQQFTYLVNTDNLNGIQNIKMQQAYGGLQTTRIDLYHAQELGKKLNLSITAAYINTNSSIEASQSRQNFINGGINNSFQKTLLNNKSKSFELSPRLEWKLDSLRKLTQIFTIKIDNKNNFNNTTFQNILKNNDTINGTNYQRSINKNIFLSTSTIYSKKISDKNMIEFGLFMAYSNSNNGNNYGSFYNENTGDTSKNAENTNRYNPTLNNASTIQGNMRYTHSINSSFSLVYNQQLAISNYHLENTIYDQGIGNNSSIKNDSLSYKQEQKTLLSNSGISLNYLSNKLEGYASLYFLSRTLESNNSNLPHLRGNFFNLTPLFNLTYSVTNYKKIRLSANKEFRPIILSYLQAIPDYSNSLVVQIPNPSLKSASVYKTSISYNAINRSKLNSFFAIIESGIKVNDIINQSSYDTLGRQTNQYINANGGHYFRGSVDGARYMLNKRLNIKLNGTLNQSFDPIYIGSNKGENSIFTAAANARVNITDKKIFDSNIDLGTSYNQSSYRLDSLMTNYNTNVNLGFDITCNFPWKGNLGVKFTQLYTYGLSTGTQSNSFLNAYIGQKVFKSRAEVKIIGYNLLDNGSNIVRNVGPNYIEDVSRVSVPRTLMLGFTYFFK